MKNTEMLIQAQMHLECLSEAWNEADADELSDERAAQIQDEIGARIWAALYLVQAARTGVKPENFDETLRSANAHNGGDFDGTQAAETH